MDVKSVWIPEDLIPQTLMDLQISTCIYFLEWRLASDQPSPSGVLKARPCFASSSLICLYRLFGVSINKAHCHCTSAVRRHNNTLCESEREDVVGGAPSAASLSEILSASAISLDLDSLVRTIQSQYSGNSSVSFGKRAAADDEKISLPQASTCRLMSSCSLELMQSVNLFRREFERSSVQLLQTVPSALWHSFDFFQQAPEELRRITGANERSRLRPQVSVTSKIQKDGYPVETHRIQTEDGYILTYYRIPYGRSNESCGANAEVGKRKSILIHHGLFGHAGFWVTPDLDKTLPYQLADLGYDVWLANCRGTNASQAHINLSSHDPKFWDYSFDEIGRYDLPAAIDYILETTQDSKLIYIGHSMGTTAFFVAMSERPEYNQKIELMVALAPVGYVHHATSIATLLAPLGFLPLVYHRYYPVGADELLDLFRTTAYGLCGPTSPTVGFCSTFYFMVYGFDYTQTDFLKLAEFIAEGTNPISIKVLDHYAQNFIWRDFRQMSEGTTQNCQDYGSCHPPKYDLGKVTAKVALIYGTNDKLAVVEDVQRTRRALPNVVLNHRVEYDYWNHMDFVVAKDVNKLVFYPVLNVINNHVKAPCEGPPFDRNPDYVDSE